MDKPSAGQGPEKGTGRPTKLARGVRAPSKQGAAAPAQPKEIGGPKGPEPTRYGDWERKGIASDF